MVSKKEQFKNLCRKSLLFLSRHTVVIKKVRGLFLRTTLLIAILFFIGAVGADVSTARNYPDVSNFIRKLATQYPKDVELINIGMSDGGVEILGVKIGSGPVHNLVVGAHHGNEYGSTELALNFAESIAKDPIEGQTIFVVPVLNIDGYNRRNRYERVNGRSIDMNRDYPGPCGTEGPHNSRSSKAMADFLAKENIVALATLHTYWPASVYPWGLSSEDVETPYTPIFMNMVQTATQFSRYQIGNAAELIYPADGTFEDYAFWKHGIWSILFEVGNSHDPDNSELNSILKDNLPGLRKMFEVAPKSRAEKHDFTGQCNLALRILDLHIE